MNRNLYTTFIASHLQVLNVPSLSQLFLVVNPRLLIFSYMTFIDIFTGHAIPFEALVARAFVVSGRVRTAAVKHVAVVPVCRAFVNILTGKTIIFNYKQ